MTSIFEEMNRSTLIDSLDFYNELLSRVNEALVEGRIKEIRPSSDMRQSLTERWFVDNISGVVFRLIEPDFPTMGWWSEVEFPERKES